jgi:hypothetical protein
MRVVLKGLDSETLNLACKYEDRMEAANTLAYYDTAIIAAVKSFIVQTPVL